MSRLNFNKQLKSDEVAQASDKYPVPVPEDLVKDLIRSNKKGILVTDPSGNFKDTTLFKYELSDQAWNQLNTQFFIPRSQLTVNPPHQQTLTFDVNRPRLTVNFSTTDILCLLDTGAPRTMLVLDEDQFLSLKLTPYKLSPQFPRCVNLLLDITIGNLHSTRLFPIVPTPYPGYESMIGMDILGDAHLTIALQKGYLSI